MFDRKRLNQRRKQLNYTLQDVADKIGLTRATVQKYESGYISDMTTTLLETFAKALDCTPAYLMCWTDEPHKTFTSTVPLQFEYDTQDEKELLTDYRQLNSDGKAKAKEYVSDLTTMDKYTSSDNLKSKLG